MPTQTPADVAANVRAEVARRGLRHADLATALGVSRPAMSRRLTCDMEFSITELRAVAEFLGVPLSVLLDEPAQAAATGT